MAQSIPPYGNMNPPPAYTGTYPSPMPPPQIIVVGQQDTSTLCRNCGRNTQGIANRTLGLVGGLTVLALIITVPIISCIPCCCDGCKDI